MLTIDNNGLDRMEILYPGIRATVSAYDEAKLPSCHQCGSEDTAAVGCGMIGRTIALAGATTKFKLVPNGPKPGAYFCNQCNKFFDALAATPPKQS